MKFTLLLRLFALLAPALACAQTTGTLAGRVSDEATGRSLQGAVVRVTDTPLSATTDADGRFSLAAVPAGARQLEVDYIGLDPVVRSVVVTAGAAASVEVALKSEALKMQAFTVAESSRGQALAINQQKTASGLVNIVSEETFGQMINGNIGYALERLPGLTVSATRTARPAA
jgi:hypothetical protein